MLDPKDILRKTKEALDREIEEKRRLRNEEDRKFIVSQIGKDIVELLSPLLIQIAENSKITREELKEIISEIKVEVPKIEIPKIEIPKIEVPKSEIEVRIPEIPEIKIPEPKITVKVPKPEVTVNIPPLKIPEMRVDFPKIMEIQGDVGLREITRDKPLPVSLFDLDGKPIDSFKEITQIISGGGFVPPKWLQIRGIADSTGASLIDSDGRFRVILPTGGVGLIDTELRAAHLDVQQLSGSADSTNVIQLSGTNVAVDSGVTGAGVQRIVHVTDVGQSTNVYQYGGNAIPASREYAENSLGPFRVIHVTDIGQSVSAAQVGAWTVSVSGSVTSTVAVGDIPAGTADTGSAPVKIGGIARTTNPTAEADGDRLSITLDDLGRQINRPVQVRDLILTAYVTLSTGTEATLLSAGAGTYADLIYIMGANDSGAAVQVDIRAVTAGNILMTLEIPPTSTAGVSLPVPFPQDATGNNWTVDMPDITGTNVRISALFSKEV